MNSKINEEIDKNKELNKQIDKYKTELENEAKRNDYLFIINERLKKELDEEKKNLKILRINQRKIIIKQIMN